MKKLSLFLGSILFSTILFPFSTFANPILGYDEENYDTENYHVEYYNVDDDSTENYGIYNTNDYDVEFDSVDTMDKYVTNTGNLLMDEPNQSVITDEPINSSSQNVTSTPNKNRSKSSGTNQVIKKFQKGAKEIENGRPPIQYVFGGNQRPTKNRQGILDCSSFTQYVYDKYFDIKLRRTTWEQYDDGQKVSINNLKPGDLVFRNGRGHVGVYLGNGKVLHNSTSKGKPVIVSLKGQYGFNPQEAVRYKIKGTQNKTKKTDKNKSTKTNKDTNNNTNTNTNKNNKNKKKGTTQPTDTITQLHEAQFNN